MLIKVITILVLLTSSCGSPTSDQQLITSDGTGSLKATVLNSKSFNPNISHGQIVQYKVTITGSGIDEPITAEFDGTEESGVVGGIPVGRDRTITVTAINANDFKIREGFAENVEIKPGDVTETEVNMESVPVFANLTDGNVIPNTRFKAVVFSDPNDPIEVSDEFDGATSALLNVSPDVSTGLAIFLPSLLPEGEHKFTVKNIRTGLSTSITVRLTDGTRIYAAPIFSAGGVKGAHLKMGQLVNF